MSFSIPGLEGYFGGKGASGVPQQIINIIPPHETLIIPFLGHCAITRTIKPARNLIAIEKDREVFLKWCRYFNPIWGLHTDIDDFYHQSYENPQMISIRNACGIEFLENHRAGRIIKFFHPKPLFYYDPPYLHETRLSSTRYEHEMTDQDHERFLSAATKIDAPSLISHYKNDMYDSYLKGWNTISFMSQTRSGKPRKETVYFNYEKPTELHDYSFYGNNYKSREYNKLKAQRLIAKFVRMKPLERNFYLNALAENGVGPHL